MANYFQDPTETFIPTPVYRPPFEALASTLMTKQKKYDDGLSNVRSARSSVFNAALTKGENAVVREQYMQQADKQLENLSQVDLSIESNQMEARNVFGNFFKDQDIVNDMVYTKTQNNEIGKFQSFKPEKDSFEYADARSLQDMQNGVDKVRSSKRGDLSVYGVREFTPFTDLTKYMGKMVVDQKIAIESVNSNGVVTYKKTNGPESLGSWMTIASAMTQDRFNKQFQVEARVAKEEGIKQTKAYIKQTTGQDATDDQALGVYIKSIYEKNYTQYKRLTTDYGDKLTKVTKARAKYLKDTPDGDVATLDAFNNEITATKQALKQSGEALNKYDPSSKEYSANVQNFKDGPDAALYDQIRNSSIQNLATFFAANEQKSIPVEDVNFKIATEAAQRNFTNELALAKNTREEGEYQAKLAGTWDVDGNSAGKKTGKDGKPLTDKEIEANDVNDLHYVGPVGNAYQDYDPVKKFESDQQTRFDAAHNTFLDPSGTAGILEDASGGTISYSEIVTYTSALRSGKEMDKYNTAEKEVATKVKKLFDEKGIVLDGTDANASARGLHTLAGLYFGEIKGTDKWNDKTIKIWNEDNAANDLINTYNSYNTQKSEKIKETLLDSKNKHLVVERANGNKDIVKGADLDKDLGDLNRGFRNYFGSKDELFADVYLRGGVKILETSLYNDVSRSGPNGPRLLLVSVDGESPYNIEDPKQIAILKAFEKKWGKSQDINKALTDANNSVVTSIAGYTKNDAQMGQEFTYHFSPTAKETDMGVKVMKEATLPGNFSVDGEGMTDDAQIMVRKIHSWSAKEVGEYMNPPIYHTNNGSGVPTVVLSFKTLTDAQLTQLNVKREDLPEKIELPLNDNRSPNLQKLLHPDTGMYTYGQLLRGETIKAGSIEKGLDFDYEMVPNKTSNPDSVKVIIHTKQLNEKGERVAMDPAPFDMSFADYTPDEMKAKVTEFIAQHIKRNVAMQTAVTDAAKKKTKEQQDRESAFKKYAESTDPK